GEARRELLDAGVFEGDGYFFVVARHLALHDDAVAEAGMAHFLARAEGWPALRARRRLVRRGGLAAAARGDIAGTAWQGRALGAGALPAAVAAAPDLVGVAIPAVIVVVVIIPAAALLPIHAVALPRLALVPRP